MYKIVCQELDCSRCSFTCKSHAAAFTQSVCYKQKGQNSQDRVCQYLLTKLGYFIWSTPTPSSFWNDCLTQFNSFLCQLYVYRVHRKKKKTATLFKEVHFHSKVLGGGTTFSLSFRVTPHMAVTLCETCPAMRLHPCSMPLPTPHKQ